MKAVSASGTSNMSDASMPFQPAIDEPSNAWPLSNLSSSNADTGTETCCSLPRVSVKRKSTNLTSSSLTSCMTSATDLLITYLLINEFGGFQPPPNLADPPPRVHQKRHRKAGNFCRGKSIGTNKAPSVPPSAPSSANAANNLIQCGFAGPMRQAHKPAV